MIHKHEHPFPWSQEMSTQPANPTKPQPKPEKNTDATAVLSPDELRAIAGGATSPPSGKTPPPGGGVLPHGKTTG
jgi:hypothetical protein